MAEARAVRRLVVVGAVVAATLGVPSVVPAQAADAAPTTILAGGVGDGGPADEALVGTGPAGLLPDGTLVFADAASHQVREYDPATGTIEAVMGVPYRTVAVPVAPADGADVDTVRLPDVSRLWVTDDGDVWLTFTSVSGLYRVDAGTGTIRRWWSETVGLGLGVTTGLVTVTPDGRLILAWREGTAGTGYVDSTRYYLPTDEPPTTAPLLLWDRAPGAMTADGDGNLYEVRGGGIWRIHGTDEVLVAGVDGPRPADAATRPDGVPALGADMTPSTLRWLGAGRLAYTESAPNVPGVPGTPMSYRVLVVGGSVRTVVGPFGTMSGDTGASCTDHLSQAEVVAGELLLGCGSAFRAWALDGSQAATVGDAIIGSTTGSAAGSPLDVAYLKDASGLVAGPTAGRVTIATSRDIRVLRLDGQGGLARVAGDGRSGPLVADGAPATSGSVYPTGGLTYGADGTLYFSGWAAADPTQGYLMALAPDGTLTRVVGGGSSTLSDGASGGEVTINGYSWSPQLQRFGSLIAFGPYDDALWGFDPATGTLSRLVGGGATTTAEGGLAKAAALGVTSFDRSEATDQLVVEGVDSSDPDDELWRVDQAGLLHALPAAPSHGALAMSDGAFVTQEGSSVLRVADGRVSLLAGTDVVVQPPVTTGPSIRIGALPVPDGSGGVVALDLSALTPRVLHIPDLTTPAPGAPAVASVRSYGHGLRVEIAPGGPGAPVHVRVAVAPGSPPMSWHRADGTGLNTTYVDGAVGATGLTFDVSKDDDARALVPGHTYGVTVWEWQPGGAAAAPQTFTLTWQDDVTPPTAAMSGPTAQTELLPDFGMAWQGSDAGSGVSGYDVRYRVASSRSGFGSYVYPAALQGTPATTGSFAASPGRQYCFSVRAHDGAGLLSAWSAEKCRVVPLDDRSLSVSTTVVRAGNSAVWQGTISRVRTAQARFVRTDVTASRIGVLATTCHGCGSVDVYLAGVLLGRISLESPTTVHQVRLWLPTGPTRQGSLLLRTRSSAPVYVDGLLSLR